MRIYIFVKLLSNSTDSAVYDMPQESLRVVITFLHPHIRHFNYPLNFEKEFINFNFVVQISAITYTFLRTDWKRENMYY
jgi:hypothetical protein